MEYRRTPGTGGGRDWSLWIPISLVATLLLTPGCGSQAHARQFKPNIVALPHVTYDPSIVDPIARGASYSAWIDPENEHVLDLAVWPNRSAAAQAARQYRAGGPKTYPDRSVLGTGFPYRVRKVERLKNITLAWYRSPTKADENEVRHALRFGSAHVSRGTFKALWLIAGTDIDPDATAATGPALYSASLDGGPISGPLTVAIWPSVRAARRYIDGLRGLLSGIEWRRVRNVTIDTAASFGSAHISHSDVRAIRGALH